ncbi:hypothetical protein SAMN05445504_7774 [Burkholderia sp. CF099]|jgi:hypothetical protein|nr:hypothetical protein SAMN05445504_7774 [Burkholderia sp. CF099]
MENFREFVVTRVANGIRETYVVRIVATRAGYEGSIALVDPQTGTRTNCAVRNEYATVRSVEAGSFFRRRKYYRRTLAGDLKRAIEDGRVYPSTDGQPYILSLGANPVGLSGNPHPLERKDAFWDWIDVFEDDQRPAIVIPRPLPPNLSKLVPDGQCNVQLIASPGGYLARLTCALRQRDEIFGYHMPLVVENPWRESIPADVFYANRQKYRDELIARIDRSLCDGSFTTVRASPYQTDDGSWPFDWIVRADLDPKKWPQGYPLVVMDDLTNWHVPDPVKP